MENLHPDLLRVLVSEEQIRSRIKELAAQISNDYNGAEKLFMIGILKGAFIFLADLCRELTVPNVVDFMAVSSYGKSTKTGAVRLIMDLRELIEGQHAIVVEDILDSGRTLRYLYQVLQWHNPASLRTCVLLRKRRDIGNVPIDYVGFDIPDAWVVGYGLDYADRFRTLPYIAELSPRVYSKQE
ncbi:MAG TPA: hypoxanthine phosphoribosyltransferase [Anaerolineales bacterium]|nr:hypoxanthine phosphoribosyltransferase [Anaerolineales bacterium]